jgi:hypothetical protein
MLSFIMMSVVMLNADTLGVIMLSVVAPCCSRKNLMDLLKDPISFKILQNKTKFGEIFTFFEENLLLNY